MAGEQNVETAKRAYAALTAGDAAGAMETIADDVEWITPGNSAVGRKVQGKREVGALGRVYRMGFTTSPQYWLSDDQRVVVLRTRPSGAARLTRSTCSRIAMGRS